MRYNYHIQKLLLRYNTNAPNKIRIKQSEDYPRKTGQIHSDRTRETLPAGFEPAASSLEG